MKEIPNLLREASLSSEVREEKFAESLNQFVEKLCGFLEQHGQEVSGRKVWEKALVAGSSVAVFIRMESLLNVGEPAGLYVIKLWEGSQPVNNKFFGSLTISEKGDRKRHCIQGYSHPEHPWHGVEIKSNIGLQPWWDVLNHITKNLT